MRPPTKPPRWGEQVCDTGPDLRFRVVRVAEWADNTQSEGPGNLAEDGADAPPVEEVAMGTILPPPERHDNHPRRTTSTLRDRWRREVYRTSSVTDSTKLLLLALSEEMREDGYVIVPRETLARRLDRTERRVSQRLAEAVEARLLDRVVRGQKGQTAVYRALMPDAVRVPDHSTLNAGQGDGFKHPEDAENRHPESRFRVPPGGPTCSKRETTTRGEPGGAGVSFTSNFSDEVEVEATTLVDGVPVVDGLPVTEVVSIFRRLGAA